MGNRRARYLIGGFSSSRGGSEESHRREEKTRMKSHRMTPLEMMSREESRNDRMMDLKVDSEKEVSAVICLDLKIGERSKAHLGSRTRTDGIVHHDRGCGCSTW